MKNSVSLIIPKPGIAKWGNFNHTTLVKAELFRAKGNEKAVAKTIEGIVRSSLDLSVLSGISVKLKGTNLEAQTDSNGWFSLIIEKPVPSDILVFTSSGFHSAQVSLAEEDFLHVNLKADLVPVEKKQDVKRWRLSSFFSL